MAHLLTQLIWILTLLSKPNSDSRGAECSQLGYHDAYRSHNREVREGVRICGPRLVLPSCYLPNLGLHHRSCWMGNRYAARKRISRCPANCPQNHRHSSLLSCHPSGIQICFPCPKICYIMHFYQGIWHGVVIESGQIY